MTCALEVSGLRFAYPALPGPLAWLSRGPTRTLQVLDGVSFRVDLGEKVCLMGANGAGKSTLLKVVLGFLKPCGGEIRLFGRPADREGRRRVGYVHPDERSFYWRLTVLQNLEFFGGLWGLDRREARARAALWAEELELEPWLGRPFADLSTGLRQRTAIARALLHGPDVLVMDEPTRSLDPPSAARFRRWLSEGPLRDKAVLLSTHGLDEAKALGGACLVLAGRRLVWQGGPPDEEALRGLMEAPL
ncbi:MAG: ABC transporter ATP-binding protein [Acidobacteriota bacterium]